MSAPTLPLDYNAARKALANAVTQFTGRTCILAEDKKGQPEDRPDLPYFSFKITSPGLKYGDDDKRYTDVANNQTQVSTGGLRGVMVSFQAFATEQEDAYGLMGLLQSGLQQLGLQETLRRAGIAVWRVGTVADLTQLLNTGFEGRAQMDVLFGMAANVVEKYGTIGSVEIEGTVDTGQGEVEMDFTAPPEGE